MKHTCCVIIAFYILTLMALTYFIGGVSLSTGREQLTLDRINDSPSKLK